MNHNLIRQVRLEYISPLCIKIQRRAEDGCFVLSGFDTAEHCGVNNIEHLKQCRDVLDAVINDFQNGLWVKEYLKENNNE